MERKQVDKEHYTFGKYYSKQRFLSLWHQIDEILAVGAKNVLEVGPGLGLFKVIANTFGISVQTIDIDPDLKPDFVGSVLNVGLPINSYDVVCAFQVLEHLPYEKSLAAFAEMVRVAKTHVVISLPNAQKQISCISTIPWFGLINFHLPHPKGLFSRYVSHKFDGQHYWEINTKNFHIEQVKKDLLSVGAIDLIKSYRVAEYPYHHFFIFGKN